MATKEGFTIEISSRYEGWWRYNVALMCGCFDTAGNRTGFASTEAHVADVGSNLREKPAGNPGGGRASLETGPCDHLLLYIYIVPHTLPALWRAEKIVSRSVKAGFNWDSAAGALDKLDEETAELRQAVEAGQPADSPHGIREELGDALFILCKIAQMSGVDSEDALHRACDKYQGRFRRVADAADRPLNAYTEAEKIALWEQAKEN